MILHFHKRSEKKYVIILPFSITHIITFSCVLLYSCRLELLLGIISFQPEEFCISCNTNLLTKYLRFSSSRNILIYSSFWRRILLHRDYLDNFFFSLPLSTLKSSTPFWSPLFFWWEIMRNKFLSYLPFSSIFFSLFLPS